MKPVEFVEVHGELDVDSGARGEGRVLDLVKAELVEAVDEFEGDAVLVLARSGLLVEDFLAFDDAHVVLAEEGRERHFDGLELVGGAGLAVACRPVVAGVDFLFAGDVGTGPGERVGSVNERSTHHRVVSGQLHDAQTPANRPLPHV